VECNIRAKSSGVAIFFIELFVSLGSRVTPIDSGTQALVLPFWSASCLPEKQRALDVLVQCRRQSRRHGVATEIGEAEENSIIAMTSRRLSKIDQQ
jgi:hypothetical protein